jgi:hypothetical protein
MLQGKNGQLGKLEDLLAEVAAATYRLAVRHGSKGAFIDVELDLWQALNTRLHRSPPGGSSPPPAGAR